MRTAAAVTVSSILAATFLMAASAGAQQVTLRHEGKDTYLVQGKARLHIANPDAPLDVYHLPNGDTVTLAGDSVRVQTKAGQPGTVSLRETLKQWVHDDSKWGGHMSLMRTSARPMARYTTTANGADTPSRTSS